MAHQSLVRKILEQTDEQVLLECDRGAILWSKDGSHEDFVGFSRWIARGLDKQERDGQRPEVLIDIIVLLFAQDHHLPVRAGPVGQYICATEIKPKFRLANTQFRIRSRDTDPDFPIDRSKPAGLRVIGPGIGYFDISSPRTWNEGEDMHDNDVAFDEALEFLFEGPLANGAPTPRMFKIQVPGAASYLLDRNDGMSSEISTAFAAVTQASILRADGQPAMVVVIPQTTEKITVGLHDAQRQVEQLKAELVISGALQISSAAVSQQQLQIQHDNQPRGDRSLVEDSDEQGPRDKGPNEQAPPLNESCLVCLKQIPSNPIGRHTHHSEHQQMFKENESLREQVEELQSLASKANRRIESLETKASTNKVLETEAPKVRIELGKTASELRTTKSQLDGAQKLLNSGRNERRDILRRLDDCESHRARERIAAAQGLPASSAQLPGTQALMEQDHQTIATQTHSLSNALSELAEANALVTQTVQERDSARADLRNVLNQLTESQGLLEKRRQEIENMKTNTEELETELRDEKRRCKRRGEQRDKRETLLAAALLREARLQFDFDGARASGVQRGLGQTQSTATDPLAQTPGTGIQAPITATHTQPQQAGEEDPRLAVHTQPMPEATQDGPATAQTQGGEPANSAPGPDHLPYCDACLTSLNKMSDKARADHVKKCKTTIAKVSMLTIQEAKAMRAQRKTQGGKPASKKAEAKSKSKAATKPDSSNPGPQPKSNPASKRKRDDDEPTAQDTSEPPKKKKKVINATPPPDSGRGKRQPKQSLKGQEAASAANAAVRARSSQPAAGTTVESTGGAASAAMGPPAAEATGLGAGGVATAATAGITGGAASGGAPTTAAAETTRAASSAATAEAADGSDAAPKSKKRKRGGGEEGEEKSGGKESKK